MKTYKQLSDELNNLMVEIQSGAIDIDESIKKYKQASKLISDMEKYLARSKVEVKKIMDSLE